MFGTERMIDALNREPGASAGQILAHVKSAVDDFVQGAEQFDDLTMLCLEYRGAAGIAVGTGAPEDEEEHSGD